MATDKKTAKAEEPKSVFFTVKNAEGKEEKYELLGGPNKKYIFQGETFTKETAASNAALLEALVKTGSPVIKKV